MLPWDVPILRPVFPSSFEPLSFLIALLLEGYGRLLAVVLPQEIRVARDQVDGPHAAAGLAGVNDPRVTIHSLVLLRSAAFPLMGWRI